jgi:predicted methyltransferase MtxX (methanogen marker protein 4)
MADLIAKIKNGGKTFVQKLPRTVVSALVSGVIKSRQVSADIKKMLI